MDPLQDKRIQQHIFELGRHLSSRPKDFDVFQKMVSPDISADTKKYLSSFDTFSKLNLAMQEQKVTHIRRYGLEFAKTVLELGVASESDAELVAFKEACEAKLNSRGRVEEKMASWLESVKKAATALRDKSYPVIPDYQDSVAAEVEEEPISEKVGASKETRKSLRRTVKEKGDPIDAATSESEKPRKRSKRVAKEPAEPQPRPKRRRKSRKLPRESEEEEEEEQIQLQSDEEAMKKPEAPKKNRKKSRKSIMLGKSIKSAGRFRPMEDLALVIGHDLYKDCSEKWAFILNNDLLGTLLSRRTNVNLKDRMRNINNLYAREVDTETVTFETWAESYMERCKVQVERDIQDNCPNAEEAKELVKMIPQRKNKKKKAKAKK